MKNKLLFFIIASIGALIFVVTESYSKSSYCDFGPSAAGTYDCYKCHGASFCEQCPGDPSCKQTSTCNDTDGDGYGDPGDVSCANGPSRDCGDNNDLINPGAVENCTDGVDNDCNNLVDAQDPNALNCPIECLDGDGDTYAVNCAPIDCDDTLDTVNPGEFELCDDGIDNDCDGMIDCHDKACKGDPACWATSCNEYTDRVNCKADPRCNWRGKDKSCIEIVGITDAQVNCAIIGGRWNRKQEVCR